VSRERVDRYWVSLNDDGCRNTGTIADRLALLCLGRYEKAFLDSGSAGGTLFRSWGPGELLWLLPKIFLVLQPSPGTITDVELPEESGWFLLRKADVALGRTAESPAAAILS
jgi:hypothetical protein